MYSRTPAALSAYEFYPTPQIPSRPALTNSPDFWTLCRPTRKAREMLLPPPENPLERLIREIEYSVRLDINLYGAVLAWTVILFFLYYCLR